MKNSVKNRIFALSSVFLAISLIFGYVEAIIPFNIGEIGIKLGLCNIITMLSFKYIGYRKSFIIGILRVLIIGVLFANLIRFSLSLSGFILSFIAMLILYGVFHMSYITTSIFGGVFHNIGQVLCLAFVTQNTNIIRLLPIYMVVGVVTGLLIGILTSIVSKIKIANEYNEFKNIK